MELQIKNRLIDGSVVDADGVESTELVDFLSAQYKYLLENNLGGLPAAILVYRPNFESPLDFEYKSDFTRRSCYYDSTADQECPICHYWGPSYLHNSEGICLSCVCRDLRDAYTETDLRSYLQRYGLKHRISGRINASKKAYMGFELEVTKGEDQTITVKDAKKVIDNMRANNMLSKQDASVYAEFVSKPLLLKDALAKVDQCVDLLQPMGFTSWQGNKCGFHVHLNKNGVKNELKLVQFFCENADILKKLCGRTNDYYCRFDPNLVWQNYITKRGPRFAALNFLNKHTIEIRGFRGTLSKPRLHCYLKLADFFANFSDNLDRFMWSDICFILQDDFFTEFCNENQLCDPELMNFANEFCKTPKNYVKQLTDFNCCNLSELKTVIEAIKNRSLFIPLEQRPFEGPESFEAVEL